MRRVSVGIAMMMIGVVLLTCLAGCGKRPARQETTGTTSVAGAPPSNIPAGSEWPAFRGPAATGIAGDTGINKEWGTQPPREMWRVSVGDAGYACPSVAEGKVFIIDREGDNDVVKALSMEAAMETWRFTYPDPGPANHGFARATPTFAEGKVYTLSRMGLLHCLDAANGAQIWSKDIRQEFGGQMPTWNYAMSPLVDEGRVIVCPGGQTGVAALNKDTGETLWTGGSPGLAGYATPVAATLDGRKQYVIFAGTKLFGVDAASGGASLWEADWTTQHDVNAATPLVIGGDYVFVTSGYNTGCGLYGVSQGRAELLWSNRELKSHFNSPVYYNGYIYGIGDPGRLVCMAPADGSVVWQQDGFEKGGLVVVDGALIAVNGADGDVVMADATPDGYRESGRIKPLGGQTWPPPIVAYGKLIVRNTQSMVCLDLM